MAGILEQVANPTPEDGPKYELTDEKKKLILDRINDNTQKPPGIKELVEICFGAGLDGRSVAAKTIKEYCGTLSFRPKSSFEYQKREIPPLTEEQKTFCANHAATMSSLEMARELYNNSTLTTLHAECLQIVAYVKSLPDAVRYKADDDLNIEYYEPPKTIHDAAHRVNKYILDCIKPADIKKNSQLTENLHALIRYCHVHRFLSMMRTFETKQDKDLFESSYIRYLHNKGNEVTEEEIDAYLNLCLDIVNHTKLQQEIDGLRRMRDQQADDSEGKRLSMSIVDMIDSLFKEMNENQKRQKQLMEILQGKRSERINTKIKENQSVIQLIDAWKDEGKRKILLNIAEKRKLLVREEIKHIETLDAFKAEIFGVDKKDFE